jgi:hypothetical protein
MHAATVLKQQRGCNGGIPRVHVNGGSVLARIQEDFCQVAVLESADASGVAYSAMLKAKQLVTTPIGQSSPDFDWAGHWRSSKLSLGPPNAGVLFLR